VAATGLGQGDQSKNIFTEKQSVPREIEGITGHPGYGPPSAGKPRNALEKYKKTNEENTARGGQAGKDKRGGGARRKDARCFKDKKQIWKKDTKEEWGQGREGLREREGKGCHLRRKWGLVPEKTGSGGKRF